MGHLWVSQNEGCLPPPLPLPPPKNKELWSERGGQRKMDQGPHHTKGEERRKEERKGIKGKKRRGEKK